MARKTENRQAAQTAAPEAPGDAAVTSENVSETADSVSEMAEPVTEKTESVLETAGSVPEIQESVPETMGKMDRILNDEVETGDTIPELEEIFKGSADREDQPSGEKVLFYIRTVNARTAVRSTPEYPMRWDNVVGTIDDRELYGIVEVVDGFGRLAGRDGWIMLDPGVVARQG